MPMFDFECSHCRMQFEDLAIGEENPVCPRCGGQSLRRLSMPSVNHKNPFPFKIGPKRYTPAPAGG